MKTSHEMAQSVLQKRDRILRRRRILRTSVCSAAGAATVAAALLITLDQTSPRGVDLIDSNMSSDNGASQYRGFDSAEKLKKAVRLKCPDAVMFEPVTSDLLTPLTMGIAGNNVRYTFGLSDGGTLTVGWDYTGNGDEKLSEVLASTPDATTYDHGTSGFYYFLTEGKVIFYWVQSGCLFYAEIPESAGSEVVSLLTQEPYLFRETSPLSLIGAFYDDSHGYRVSTENWEVLTDYDIFREYFFATWDIEHSNLKYSEITIDDSESSTLFANSAIPWFEDFYRVSDNVYAFTANAGGNLWLFWLDSADPDTMYFEEMNGGVLFSHSVGGTAVFTKTDSQVKQPESGFMSVFRLREMAQEYGIDLETLLHVEYDNGEQYILYHDGAFEFYPVYIVSKSADKIVLRTMVGNMVTGKEMIAVYTLTRSDGEWKQTDIKVGDIAGYMDYSSADIPEMTPEEQGLAADGARNVLLDTKFAGDCTAMLVGDYVNADPEGHPGMINCSKFGVALYDGTTVSGIYGIPLDRNQGGYWIYTDRLSDYMSAFRFGENYIIVLRYYDSDGTCRAVFHAIKDGTMYPQLMGDYSAVNGVQTGVTAMLSENLSVDGTACTITDNDSGISYIFDFDAISDTYTRPHYIAVKADSAAG